MTITERTLRKWRAEALKKRESTEGSDCKREVGDMFEYERILHLTQVLLDQHLLRKVKKT